MLFRTVEQLQDFRRDCGPDAGPQQPLADRRRDRAGPQAQHRVRRARLPDLFYRSFIVKGLVLHLTTSRTPSAEESGSARPTGRWNVSQR
jgi:hypothetical protein